MFWAVAAAVVLVDRVSKWWVVHRLEDRRLVGDFLRLTPTENDGAAFGLFPGARAVFLATGIAAALGLLFVHRRLPQRDVRQVFLGLVLGGNLGNWIDRALSGRVTDFLDMGIGTSRWPIYNLADVAVLAGAIGLAVRIFVPAGKRTPAAPAAGAPQEPPVEG